MKIFTLIIFIGLIGLNADYIQNKQNDSDQTYLNSIIDTSTTYMWQDDTTNTSTMTWVDANNYCNSLALNNIVWTLPNFNQLFMLSNRSKITPAIDLAFTSIKNDQYWTSSTNMRDETKAWIVDFNDGSISSEDKTSTKYVRCISK